MKTHANLRVHRRRFISYRKKNHNNLSECLLYRLSSLPEFLRQDKRQTETKVDRETVEMTDRQAVSQTHERHTEDKQNGQTHDEKIK